MPAWNFATLVDAIARATPDREVVVDGTRRITWQQLASRARSLAWYLQAECGLGAADKVTIVLPNCLEYVEAFLATRKLHGVPLGLDPGSGIDVLGTAIDGSDAHVVFCSHAMTQHPAHRLSAGSRNDGGPRSSRSGRSTSTGSPLRPLRPPGRSKSRPRTT